jgi:hypothetical protein
MTIEWAASGRPRFATNSESALVITDPRLEDADTYEVTATNSEGTTKTKVNLQIIQMRPVTLPIRRGEQLTVSYSGIDYLQSTDYSWKKRTSDGTFADIPADQLKRFSFDREASKIKLTIRSPHPSLEGDYRCSVFGMDQGIVKLVYPRLPATHAEDFEALPSGGVSVPYLAQIPLPADVARAFTTHLVSGLPSGLTCDVSTGIISGIPTKHGDYRVRIGGRNGAGAIAARTVAIHIRPLSPKMLGPWVAAKNMAGDIWDPPSRSSRYVQGCRVDVTVSASGRISGKIMGKPFTAKLTTKEDGSAEAVSSLVSINWDPSRDSRHVGARLFLRFQPELGEFEVQLHEQAPYRGYVSGFLVASLSGWHNAGVDAVSLSSLIGHYTFEGPRSRHFHGSPRFGDAVPQGRFNGTIDIAPHGVTTVICRSPLSITVAFLHPSMRRVLLHTPRLQLTGPLDIGPDGKLTTPYYKGGRYNASNKGLLSAATFRFDFAPAFPAYSKQVTILSERETLLPKPAVSATPSLVSLGVDRTSGTWSGKLRLTLPCWSQTVGFYPLKTLVVPFHGVLHESPDGSVEASGHCPLPGAYKSIPESMSIELVQDEWWTKWHQIASAFGIWTTTIPPVQVILRNSVLQ